MPVATPATRALWLLALPVLAFFVLAWPAVHGPFVFDDFPNLAALAKTGAVDSWRALGIYLSESRYFPGRPLAMLSFLPQQASWPGDPLPFKVVNLLLHGANALLLWALLRRVTAAVMTPDRSRLVAALAAVAWLVHPMQLSTVFLVVQRMTLLATFFVLLGLLAYVQAWWAARDWRCCARKAARCCRCSRSCSTPRCCATRRRPCRVRCSDGAGCWWACRSRCSRPSCCGN